MKLPAVSMLLVAWIPLEAVREPLKELEPVPVEKTRPEVVRLPVAWTPKVVFRLPAKLLEAVVFCLIAPEMEAYPAIERLEEIEAILVVS